MFKVVLKLVVWVTVFAAAVAGLLYWEKATAPEYIEVYSDDADNDLF